MLFSELSVRKFTEIESQRIEQEIDKSTGSVMLWAKHRNLMGISKTQSVEMPFSIRDQCPAAQLVSRPLQKHAWS